MKDCYFVIYDLDDNIVAYLDNVKEVFDYTGIDIFNLYHRIKKGFCYYQSNGSYKKIYKFR